MELTKILSIDTISHNVSELIAYAQTHHYFVIDYPKWLAATARYLASGEAETLRTFPAVLHGVFAWLTVITLLLLLFAVFSPKGYFRYSKTFQALILAFLAVPAFYVFYNVVEYLAVTASAASQASPLASLTGALVAYVIRKGNLELSIGALADKNHPLYKESEESVAKA